MRRSRIDFAKNGPLLRISDAAEMTGLEMETIQREINEGRLPAYRVAKRCIRINPVDLQRWAQKNSDLVGTLGPDGVTTFAVADLMSQPVVYRLIGRRNELLYIGSTKNIANRLSGHARVQPWWKQVQGVGVQRYKTIEEARQAEALAISMDNPKHNVARPMVDWDAAQPALRLLAEWEDRAS